MAAFVFRVDRLTIRTTRSVDNDTDIVSLSVKAGDQSFPPVTKALGDLGNGDHEVGLQLGPIDIEPHTNVAVSFLVLNSGYDQSNEGVVKVVMDVASSIAGAITDYYLTSGSDA